MRLSAVRLGVVLRLGSRGIQLLQVFGRRSNIVPAAILKIDQGFLVAVNRDDAADDASKPLQFGALGVDLDELIGPFSFQFFVTGIGEVHWRILISKGLSSSGNIRLSERPDRR